MKSIFAVLLLINGLLSVTTEEFYAEIEKFRRSNLVLSKIIFLRLANPNYNMTVSEVDLGQNFVFSPVSIQIFLGAFAGLNTDKLTTEEIFHRLFLRSDTFMFEKMLKTMRAEVDDAGVAFYTNIYVKKNYTIKTDVANRMNREQNVQIIAMDENEVMLTQEMTDNWKDGKATSERLVPTLMEDFLSMIGLSTFTVVGSNPSYHADRNDVNNKHRKMIFTYANASTASVPILEEVGNYNYYFDNTTGIKFLEMPFLGEGEKAKVVFVLPTDPNELFGLESAFVFSCITRRPLVRQLVHYKIPEFRLHTILNYTKLMESYGIRRLFTPQADFTLLGGSQHDLYVNTIAEQIMIDIDETTVAPLTYDNKFTSNARYQMNFNNLSSSAEFVADKPFLFYVTVNNMIIFVGKYSGPEKK